MTTGVHADYAARACGPDALDILVKPIAFQRFLKACNKAKEAIEVRKQSPTSNLNLQHDHFFY